MYSVLSTHTQIYLFQHNLIISVLCICKFAYLLQLTSCSLELSKTCLTLRSLMNCSTSGFPVLHHLLEFAQTHVHWVSDAIQLSHPLLPPSPLALNLSQHQGLFQWAVSSRQVAKGLELHSISPSNEYSGLISFKIDWFDLAVQDNVPVIPKPKLAVLWWSFTAMHRVAKNSSHSMCRFQLMYAALMKQPGFVVSILIL